VTGPGKQRLRAAAGKMAPGALRWWDQAKDRRGRRSYSQEGEDRILHRMFEFQGPGFYVDVGAHHPFRFSNTYLFYRSGWRGVNIDACPGSMEVFKRERPEDVNIEAGVNSTRGSATFFMFDEPALNSFDETLSRSRDGVGGRIVREAQVPQAPLRDLLEGHLPKRLGPSFLSVDVEGRDLEVLQSNDWTTFRPDVVLAECLGADMAALPSHPVVELLRSVDFAPAAKTVNTVFFKRQR
jgi:FkbM family methyltransferase